MRKQLLAIFLAASALLAPLHAKAGIPVIDVTAVANLIQQVMYWQQQISAMQKQFDQLKASKEQLQQTYSSMTGTRGMDQLLPMSNMDRNYLPQNYNDLMGVVNGSTSGYSGLSGQVKSIMDANSILSTTQMDALSPDLRQMVDKGRRASAMLNGLTRNAQTRRQPVGFFDSPKMIRRRLQITQGLSPSKAAQPRQIACWHVTEITGACSDSS